MRKNYLSKSMSIVMGFSNGFGTSSQAHYYNSNGFATSSQTHYYNSNGFATSSVIHY